MNKKMFEDELISGMQQELRKQASATPNLVKAAECLHAALEIFESQGLHERADQVLQVLEKIGKNAPPPIQKKAKSLQELMQAGITQRDLREFARGNPVAVGKLNLALRKMGLSDHEIGKFLGPGHLMTEEQARKAINPNEPGSTLEFQSIAPPAETTEGSPLDFKSLAQSHKQKDGHLAGLTPEKQVKNLLDHGTQFNLANDVSVPPRKDKLTADDMEADFADILKANTFDIDASDDELMGMEVKDDSLEVFDGDTHLDFEDERD